MGSWGGPATEGFVPGFLALGTLPPFLLDCDGRKAVSARFSRAARGDGGMPQPRLAAGPSRRWHKEVSWATGPRWVLTHSPLLGPSSLPPMPCCLPPCVLTSGGGQLPPLSLFTHCPVSFYQDTLQVAQLWVLLQGQPWGPRGTGSESHSPPCTALLPPGTLWLPTH